MIYPDDRHTHPEGLAAKAKRRASEGGYILLEALVALTLLGVISYSIHGTFQQALMTRGQAQDYTRVRFLLEKVVADQQLQPLVVERADDGFFDGEGNDRFWWEYKIKKIRLPKPPEPTTPPPRGRSHPVFRYPLDGGFLVHIVATVSWRRGGRDFSESIETLFSPQKLWQSKEEEEENIWAM